MAQKPTSQAGTINDKVLLALAAGAICFVLVIAYIWLREGNTLPSTQPTPVASRTAAPRAGSDAPEDSNETGNPLVEIQFKYPQVLVVDSPQKVPDNVNLQEQLEKFRDPLFAPADVRNLAAGKPVSSSDEPIEGDLEQITDGDKETMSGSLVTLNYDTQWVQIDLGETCEIWGIVIWHFHEMPRIYRDVIVQIADDEDFTTNVHTVFNNDGDNSSKMGVGTDKEYFDEHVGKLIRVDAQQARYVRCYSNGSTADDQNHYIEIEVHGRTVKE